MSRSSPRSRSTQRRGNPKRRRRKPPKLTPEDRERLRQQAYAVRPWEHSTGPKTPEGKARSAANGKLRQRGPISVRQRRRAMAEVRRLLETMAQLRKTLPIPGTPATEGLASHTPT